MTASWQAISEKIGPSEVVLLVASALVAFGIASAFWRVGLRSYTGASA